MFLFDVHFHQCNPEVREIELRQKKKKKRRAKDKASYIFKSFTVDRRDSECFPASVKGGINFSWQRHAVVILCEETCCYFDLAIIVPK